MAKHLISEHHQGNVKFPLFPFSYTKTISRERLLKWAALLQVHILINSLCGALFEVEEWGEKLLFPPKNFKLSVQDVERKVPKFWLGLLPSPHRPRFLALFSILANVYIVTSINAVDIFIKLCVATWAAISQVLEQILVKATWEHLRSSFPCQPPHTLN